MASHLALMQTEKHSPMDSENNDDIFQPVSIRCHIMLFGRFYTTIRQYIIDQSNV